LSAVAPGAMQFQAQEPEEPWTNEVEDVPSAWPKVDNAPACDVLKDGRVIVRWLVDAKQMLKQRANVMQKLSKRCPVTLGGKEELQAQLPKLSLKLLPIPSGQGRKESNFDASNGWGKVQIRLEQECAHPWQVRIAVGRDDRAQAWKGPQEATFRGKTFFELSGVEWDFKLAKEDERAGKHPLAIVVELAPASL